MNKEENYEELESSKSVKLHEELESSKSVKLHEELESSESVKLHEELESSESVKLYEDLEPYEVKDGEILDKDREKKTDGMKEILAVVFYISIIVVIMLISYSFIAQHVQVVGSSMEPTLSDKDHLFVEKLSYRFGEPERYDIIVFPPNKEDKKLDYVKRIIGMPKETIQIIEGAIYINGQLLEEGYGNGKMKEAGIAEEPLLLGEDEYFVLGDNRNNSKDSRLQDIGKIKREDITGRAFICIWPLDHISILKHQ